MPFGRMGVVSVGGPLRALDRRDLTISKEQPGADAVACLSRAPVRPLRPSIIDLLERAATRDGERVSQRVSAWAQAGSVASWLIAQCHGSKRTPVMFLQGVSRARTILRIATLRAGIPSATLSFGSRSPDGLKHFDCVLSAVAPGLVFSEESSADGAALDLAEARGARVVTVDGERGLAFAALANCPIDASVAERRLHIDDETVAAILVPEVGASLHAGGVETHGDLAAIAQSFDENGFLSAASHVFAAATGESGLPAADNGHAVDALRFIAGTWVGETTVGTRLIEEARPYVREIVPVSVGGARFDALLWLDAEACRGPDAWRPALTRRLVAFNENTKHGEPRLGRALPLFCSIASGEDADGLAVDARPGSSDGTRANGWITVDPNIDIKEGNG